MDVDHVSSAALEEPVRRTRAELVDEACLRWSDELAALGGRDPLLHFRDLKVGTLDLAAAESGSRRQLLDGAPAAISRLFPHEPMRTSSLRSARAIRDKGKELGEERGLGVCLLAVGIATWSNPFAAHRPTAPVLLRRARVEARDAAETDFLITIDDDAVVNPVLLHALDAQLGLRFSPEDLRDSGGQLRYTTVVERLREFAPPHVVDGFSIAHRAVLATFATEPLMLTADLAELRPGLAENDAVAALAGDEQARQRLWNLGAGQHEVTPPPEHPVLDTDSSQAAAITAAMTGSSLRIDAPPGSGRTQTVANLVSELVGSGRSVLVLGQKQATLAEMVSRLDAAGLGDMVLNLPALTPTTAVSQVGQTIRRLRDRPPPAPPVGAATARAGEAEEHLDRYRDGLHRRREPWGTSAYDAMVTLATAPEIVRTSARIPVAALTEHDADSATELRLALEEYAELEGLTLTEHSSAWYGAQVFTQEQAERAGTTAVGLRENALPTLRDAVTRAAVEVGLPGPTTPAECFELIDLLQDVSGIERTFGPSVWSAPVPELAAATATRSWRQEQGDTTGWLARRALLRQVRDLTGEPVTNKVREELHSKLARAAELQRLWDERARDNKTPRTGPHLPQAADAVDAARRRFDVLAELSPRLAELPSATFEDANAQLGSLVLDEHRLFARPRLLELDAVLRTAQLDELVAELRERGVGMEDAGAAYGYTLHASLLEHWQEQDPDLGRFDRARHEEHVETFRENDAQALRENAIGVVAARDTHFREVAATHPEQAAVAARAGMAPRPRTPRELVQAAPDVTLAALPCWVASPLAVPGWLPPNARFDTVVIEDAGRLAIAQAVPALARAAQVVLVGDEAELALTSFTTAVEAATQREPDGPWGEVNPDSVVDSLAEALPVYGLTGQYRVRDDRLVGFAARTAYAGRLNPVPGAGGDTRVVLETVQTGVDRPSGAVTDTTAAESGTEEAGSTAGRVEKGADHSAAEVERVVEVVLEHLRARPHESLGVVTLNAEHAERLEAAIRRALVHVPDLADLLEEGAEEAFFVKDVERVTGDVRDAIVFSLGYGRSGDGRVLYRFGALDRPGGEHRLAAATTRARERLTVVTSFGSEDLSPRRLVTPGAIALREFLEYVEHAQQSERLGSADDEHGRPDPLAAVAAEKLRTAGAVVVEGLGEGMGAVPVAVRHPSRTDRFVLAVETDGPTYAAATTGRERERIRHSQLRRLGWSVHRVWSSAWATDPEGETERLLTAYERAIEAADSYDFALAAVGSDPNVGLDDEPEMSDAAAGDSDSDESGDPALSEPRWSGGSEEPEPVESEEEPNSRPGSVLEETAAESVPAYEPASPRQGSRPQPRPGGSISAYTGPELVALARWYESDEHPRPIDDVVRGVIKELRLDAANVRAQAVVRHAVRVARAGSPPRLTNSAGRYLG